MRKCTPRADRAGFTILEAAVAAAIVGLAAVGVLAAFGTELSASGRVRQAMEADALANDRLARARLLSREELVPLPDSLRRGRFSPPFQAYQWQLTSGAVHGERRLFDVTATVAWENGSYAVSTRLYR